MKSNILQQPWQTWAIVPLGVWCAYSLIGHVLLVHTLLRPDIISAKDQFFEALVRLGGLAILVVGVVSLFLKRRVALFVLVIGFVVYIAPWIYRYYEAVARHPQPPLVWHMIKTYPKLTWQVILVPTVLLILAIFASRRIRVAIRPMQPTADSGG